MIRASLKEEALFYLPSLLSYVKCWSIFGKLGNEEIQNVRQFSHANVECPPEGYLSLFKLLY